MKQLLFYKTVLNLNTIDQIFNFFIENLQPSNRIWSYFINWDKVFNNTKKIEVVLNTLNYLIAKNNFDEEFIFLIKEIISNSL